MHQVGLLLLTCPTRRALDHLGNYLKFASSVVCNRLYIKHEPELSKRLQTLRNSDKGLFIRSVPAFYFKASEVCSNIDVRVLQACTKSSSFQDRHIKQNFDVVLTDSCEDEGNIMHYLKEEFNKTCPRIVKLKPHENMPVTDGVNMSNSLPKMYKTVVLGGTFDRLHSGHKVLLSEAILRTSEKLVIGVTDGLMLQSKVLWGLIEPVEQRIQKLNEFLVDVDPTVEYYIVPIYDGYGPSVEMPEIECIVVSEETTRGGNKVNEERIRRGFKELDMHVVPLVEYPDDNILDEVKISSSVMRMNLLGTLLKKPQPKPHLSLKLYMIGLWGGVSSNSALIASILQSVGVPVINCDELLCSICSKDATEFNQVVQEFGNEICDIDGNINYCVLEKKVLQNKHKTEWINSLFQSKLEAAVKKEIVLLQEKGVTAAVLKVSTITDRFWEEIVHEVWATIVSKSQGVQNIKSKYHVSDEEAVELMSSETSSFDAIREANVVLSTNWDADFTRKQVEKALQHIPTLQKEKENGNSQL